MNIQEYQKLSDAEKIHYLTHILPPNVFNIVQKDNNIIIEHIKYLLQFTYIPSGSFEMGLSLNELNKVKRIFEGCIEDSLIEELVSSSNYTVKDFLVTIYPIQWSEIHDIFPNMKYTRGNAWLSKNDVDRVCDYYKMRLLEDFEWEYAVQSIKRHLFPFGDEIITDIRINNWFYDKLHKSNAYTELGISDVFCGEWTNTLYPNNDLSDSNHSEYCIRGGAVNFWPFQEMYEWFTCLCAYKMSSEGLFDDKCACFRLVYDL